MVLAPTNKTIEIMHRAIEKFGVQLQSDMFIEEAAELTQAIIRLRRGRVTCDAVVEEIADVWIMINQLVIIFGPEKVMPMVESKINRLERAMQK